MICPEWRTKSIRMKLWKMPPSLNVSKPTLRLLNHSLCFKGVILWLATGWRECFTSHAYGHITSMIAYDKGWNPGKTSWFIQTHKSSKEGGCPIFSWTLVGNFPCHNCICYSAMIKVNKFFHPSPFRETIWPYQESHSLSYTWLNIHGGKEHWGERKHLKEETKSMNSKRHVDIFLLL